MILSILVFALLEWHGVIFGLSKHSVCYGGGHASQSVSRVPCDLSEPDLVWVFIYLFIHNTLISQMAGFGRKGILFNSSVIRCRQPNMLI